MKKDLEYVCVLCKGLGVIQKFEMNEATFGNIELEIVTPKGVRLNIYSDRGKFECYLKSKSFFGRLTPIDKMLREEKFVSFSSLEEVIDYLKNNLETIESKSI